MEEKRENLKLAIEGLSNYQSPDIWSKISEKLTDGEEKGRENLLNALDGLKASTAPDVWDQIISQMEPAYNQRRKNSLRILWSIAASVVLLVVAFIVFRQSDEYTGMMTSSTYSTEEIDVFEVDFKGSEFENTDDNVLQYVNKNCRLMMAKCENPKFKGLYDTYLELGKAKEELKGKIDQISNKEQLYKYLIRLEKDQAEIGKDLLKMLRYS